MLGGALSPAAASVPEAGSTSTSRTFEAEAERLVELGAIRISPDVQEYGPARWIVMNDPEGNEFCVCNPPPF